MIKGITVIEIKADGTTNDLGHQSFDSFGSITKTLGIDHQEYLWTKDWWERGSLGETVMTKKKDAVLIITNEPEPEEEKLPFLGDLKEWTTANDILCLLGLTLGIITLDNFKDLECHQTPVYNVLCRFLDDLFIVGVLQRNTGKGWYYRANPKFDLSDYDFAHEWGVESTPETKKE